MIDRTEQERLLLYFIALKSCKMKGSIQRQRSATRPEPAGPEILSGFGSGFGLMFNG